MATGGEGVVCGPNAHFSPTEEAEDYYLKIQYQILNLTDFRWHTIFVDNQIVRTLYIEEVLNNSNSFLYLNALYKNNRSHLNVFDLDIANSVRNSSNLSKIFTKQIFFQWNSVHTAYFIFGMVIVSIILFLIVSGHYLRLYSNFLRRSYQLEQREVRLTQSTLV